MLYLEANSHNILTDAAIVDDRVEFPRVEVKHPDVLVTSSGNHAAIPAYCEAVDLVI